MKFCKICKRPIKDGTEDMGPICEHKFGEETNIIMNYQTKLEEIEKKFDVSEMGNLTEYDVNEVMDKPTPPNSGIYLSIFKRSVKKEDSMDELYWTTRPLLNDLENQGLIRHSSVGRIISLKAMHKHPPLRDTLMKLIRDAQK